MHPILRPSTLLPLAVLLLPVAAPTQGPTFTSPPGLLSTEGNSREDSWLGRSPNSQESSQHITLDQSQTGAARTGIRAAWFRRDAGTGFEPTAVARTTTVGMRMAHGDYSQVRRGDFADVNNVLSSPWTVVYTEKPTNLPDWRQQPAGQPAGWSVRLPFDVPFDYDGVQGLLYQVIGYGSTAPADSLLPVDKEESAGFYIWVGPDHGVGCSAGGSGPMQLGAQWWVFSQQDTSLRVNLDNAPPNQPAVLNLGLSDPAFALPGLCTMIHSSAEISVGMGLTDLGGSLGYRLEFPHQPAYVGGLDFHLQAWTFDPNAVGIPLAGSNGNQLAPYPAPPPPGPAIVTSTVGVGTSGQSTFFDYVFWGAHGGIVTGFEN